MSLQVPSEEIIPAPLPVVMKMIGRRMRNQWLTGRRMGGTPLVIGPPGVGKTECAIMTAREVVHDINPHANLLVHVVVPPEFDPIEVRGLGMPVKGPTGQYDRMRYTRSGVLPSPEEVEMADYVLLFLDEIMQSQPHFPVLAGLLNDYKAGDTYLDPKKFFVIGAGNDVSHRAGAVKAPTHVIGRSSVLYAEPDLKFWLDGFATNTALSLLPPVTPAFAEFKPSLMATVNLPTTANTPYMSMRTFTNGVRALIGTFCDMADPDFSYTDPAILDEALSDEASHEALVTLASHVGRGAAMEFLSFARVRSSVVPLSEIMHDPLKAPLPDDTMQAWLAQSSFIGAWCTDVKRAVPLLRYTARLRPDLIMSTSARMQRTLKLHANKNLSALKVYQELMVDNKDMVIGTFGR